jgi:hypothetical protein
MASDWVVPRTKIPFCPRKTCLYYAGDFDSSDSNAGALFNANDPDDGLEGQTWVGVKPTAAALITGTTFNEFFTASFIGTNSTPFKARTGITTGNAGKLICNTSGHSVLVPYLQADFGLVQYSVVVKKLKKACKVQVGTKGATYVNLLPTDNGFAGYGGYGYLASTDGTNHKGWPNDPNDCYFNGAAFGVNYGSCSGQGSGLTLFSIALTGTE